MVDLVYMKALGQSIREVRREKRLSANELHYRTRLSYSTLSKIEQGRVYPKVDTLLIICQTLGINLSALFVMAERKL